jgi:DNA processing protein
MIETVEDLEYLMGWDFEKQQPSPKQLSLFLNLTDEEQQLINILKEENNLMIDIICLRANMPVSKVSPLLLKLEFSGVIKSLPGKVYRLLN